MIIITMILYIMVCSVLGAKSIKPRRPRLVIFDLDRTLWPPWSVTGMKPPFYKNNLDNTVLDSQGKRMNHYKGASVIMTSLQSNNISMGIIANTTEPSETSSLIQLFGWKKFFGPRIYYSENLDSRIIQCSKECMTKLDDMLYFSNDLNLVDNAVQIGVVSCYIRNGMKLEDLLYGLKQYSDIRLIF